jgi:hypothetical protein
MHLLTAHLKNTGSRTGSTRTAPSAQIEVDEELPAPEPQQRSTLHAAAQKSSRKRPSPAPPADDQDAGLDVMDLLPGSRIVKRRKIVEEEERRQRGDTILPPKPPADAPAKRKPKGTKVSKPIEDTFAVQAREIREKELEKAEKAREEERTLLDGVDIEGLKNLAIVEVVPLKPRVTKPVRDSSVSARWKSEWNGRKNYKKFRRVEGGAGNTKSVNGPKVFVDLIDHKGRDYGLGDGKSYYSLYQKIGAHENRLLGRKR